MPSSRIVDYLPAYARLLDEKGVLVHFSIALQTQVDECLKAIEQAETIFDPNTCPPQWLHYTAQTVGMSAYGEHYLGVGLSASWPDWYKRESIQRFSKYTSQKGTEWGIREAISLWLQWTPAHDENRLTITLSMGDRAMRDMPGYQNDRTRYGADRLRMFPEKKQLGGGDQARSTRVRYRSFSGQAYSIYGRSWSDRRISLDCYHKYDSDGSVMATQRPRMNFYLAESEWNRIFPNILILNNEIWNTFASPYVYGWLTYGCPPMLLEIAPELQNLDIEIDPETGFATIYQTKETSIVAGMQYGQKWRNRTRWASNPTTEIKTGIINIEPGQRFGDRWNIAIKKGGLYRPKKRLVTWNKVTQNTGTIACVPGDSMEVKTGTETIEIPAIWCDSNTIQTKLSGLNFYGDMPYFLDLRPVGKIETFFIQQPLIRTAGLFVLESIPSITVPSAKITVPSAKIETFYFTITDLQLGSYLPKISIAMPYTIQTTYTNKRNYIDMSHSFEAPYIALKSAPKLIEQRPARSHSFGSTWGRSPIYHRPKQPSAMAVYTGNIETFGIDMPYSIETPSIIISGNARTVTKTIKKIVRLCNVVGYKKRSIASRIKKRSKLSDSYDLFKTYPILKTVSNASNWELQFQADRLYRLKPSAIFWANSSDGKTLEDRALQPDIQTGRLNLYLEFLMDCDRDFQVETLSLRLQGKVLIGRRIAERINLTRGTAFGVRIGVPLRFASNTSTIANDWATRQYLEQLQDQYNEIKSRVPLKEALQLPVPTDVIPSAIPPDLGINKPEKTLTELLKETSEGMQIIVNNLSRIAQGNKVFPKALKNPEITIDQASGLTQSRFEISTGLGDHNFTIATLTTTSEPITEIERPEIRLTGFDSVELVFWSAEPIPSNQFQVWICQGSIIA
jgi:hypothetical protein